MPEHSEEILVYNVENKNEKLYQVRSLLIYILIIVSMNTGLTKLINAYSLKNFWICSILV